MTTATEQISDRLLDQGQGLIVGYPTENLDVTNVSNDLQTLRAYFFRVAVTQKFYYKYDQIGSLVSGETIDFGYLGDGGIGSGEDILRIEQDDFHVLHFGYSPENPDLNVYEKVSPSSESNLALSRRGGYLGPQPGDNEGFFTSAMGDSWYDPPAETERLSFRNDDDGEFLQWGFEATDDITNQGTTIHLVGRGYKLLPETDTKKQDEMLDVAINGSDDDANGLPTVLTQVGGLGSYNLGTDTPDNWTDDFSRTIDYRASQSGTQTPGR